MKRFWFWFGMQFLSYALIVANGRAYTHGLYAWTAVTDGLIGAQGFLLLKRFTDSKPEDKDRVALAGYVLGGVAGSLFSIWLTKIAYGE